MPYKNSKIYFVLAAAMLLSLGCNYKSPSAAKVTTTKTTSPYNTTLLVGNKKLDVQIATTTADMAQGLSNREPLKDNEGMLFDFVKNIKPGFWMKDMLFDLDFIWIADQKIIAITPKVPAPKFSGEKLPLYYPPQPVAQVLEVNAGWAEKNSVRIGDEVILKTGN